MNSTKHLHKITTTTLALTLLLQGSLSWADDTEIFFGQVSKDIKPNVLFILDNSGSMNMCLNNQTRPCTTGDSRMKTLKNTMNTLLDDIKGVNVGLMTLRYDNNATAPLKAEVKDIEASGVRDKLKKEVDKLSSDNWTPIVGTLYDAALYLNADQPDYQSHKSPIECQPTHLVLLTDGQANKNSDPIRNAVKSLTKVASCTERGSLDSSSIKGETCGIELATWMRKTNQNKKYDGTTITTHTIGFALDADPAHKEGIQQFLKDLSAAGGGQHHLAKDAPQLIDAFNDIIRQATQIKNTSLVNPSPAGNDYNSGEHKKQVYYPMFEPVERDRWPGNLKRYNLDSNHVEIDKKGAPAKNDDNQFISTAHSLWSAEYDGNDVSKGGAASKLPEPNKRNLWVVFDDGTMEKMPTVQTNGNTINLTPDVANSKIISTLSNSHPNKYKTLLRYIRGFENDGKTARRILGDPQHSAPTLFSYECQGDFNQKTGKCAETADKENSSQMAIIGTNEGFVQMFKTDAAANDGGAEQFAFMPEELLKNIDRLYENNLTGSNQNIYGMDNTVTVWVDNANENGTFEKSAKRVYAYATMRRGGKSIYALDITDRTKPALKWKITAGDAGFERLGETWSVPVKTKIKIEGEGKATDVLIFAGGYNNDQDNPNNYGKPAPNEKGGNDIYIVRAAKDPYGEGGELIWRASSDDKVKEKMHYSIPGNIRVLSLDDKGNERADGLATQFFVGDVGGQVWRFIIDNGELNNIKGGGENNSGVLASLGGAAGQGENARRFYHGPDVATDGEKLFVNIGSGYRAHPLDTKVHDRMYSLHVDLTDNGETITENKLSALLRGKFNGEQTSADIKNGKRGWRIELQELLGEKIISTPKSIRGRVFFNTYTPPKASSDPCAVGKSENRTYELRVEDATPSAVAKGGQGDYSGYAILSKSQGALGDPNVICFEDTCRVQFGRGEFSDPFSRQAELGRKTYWIDLAQ